ncbi:unnamed protein product [Alternaria alternata]
MDPTGTHRDHEVVDLLSDSETEDESFTRRQLEDFDARSAAEFAHDYPEMDDPIADFRTELREHDHQFIDLTEIPDVDVPPSDAVVVEEQEPQPEGRAPEWGDEATVVTEAACLQMVLSVLPDISVDYVLKLIQEKTTDTTRTTAQCEHFLTELLEGDPYPKESDDANNKKRKREDEAESELSTYEKAERDPEIGGYEHDATELLKDEFLTVPVRHITRVLKEEKTLYKAYCVLEQQVRDYAHVAKTFSLINKSRNKRGVQLQLIEQGSQIPKELHAAKKKREVEAGKSHLVVVYLMNQINDQQPNARRSKTLELAEEANLKHAEMNNEMGECVCCFDDVPLNRMISCNGDIIHFYCVNCPRQQIETQMGQSRCRPKCFGVDDCNGTFTRRQLQQVLSDTTFERLEHMQQREDLEAAGLDFLLRMPILRLQNGVPASRGRQGVSMRESEVWQDELPYLNVQCYVCSKNVTDYNHFGDAVGGKCPLHENIEDRHEQEIKRAADEAMAKVRADNPDLSDADLMVQVSDRVKQAEDARKGRATAEAQAFPYHMVGEQLRHAPVGPPLPAIPAFGRPPPVNLAPDRYVHPHPGVIPVPAFGYRVQPIPFYQPFYPVQHIGYYGAVPPQQPRPLDALWDMLPPNPLRNLVNAVGPDDERVQQAHRPAAVGAVDRFNLDRVQLGHHHDHRDMFRRPQEANHQAPQVDREARVIAAGLRLQEANRDYLEFRQQRRDMRRLQRLEADGAQVEGLLQRDAEAGAGIVPQRQCQRSEPEDRMPLEDGSGSFSSLYNVLDTTWHDIRGLGYARCVYAPGDS